ncbi:MAG TPA: hypothetical protein VHA57_02860 [Actinomycetota bacterium]|nr:hypothetical protein [Actinomycetota bacterium]
MRHPGVAALAGVLLPVLLAACSSTPKNAASTPGAGAGASPSAPAASPAASSYPSPYPSPSASASLAGAAQNLIVTDALRAQLLAAGAALHGLPTSDYTGLVAGQTYYAFDPATGTYWAGAALSPSASSYQAQVSAQDDGSYLLFEKQSGGTWTAKSDGLTGIPGSTCPLPVPAAVLALWHWTSGTCRPAG